MEAVGGWGDGGGLRRICLITIHIWHRKVGGAADLCEAPRSLCLSGDSGGGNDGRF